MEDQAGGLPILLIGIGFALMGLVMAYAAMRYRRRTRQEAAIQDEGTKRAYREAEDVEGS